MIRVGEGYDVHRLTAGRPLVLGGVTIEYELGLDGHSDADVLAHAVTDAMLGAAAMGDIGRYFPDTDPTYKDANSMALLAKVAYMVVQRGFDIVNIDACIIAQAPKIAPHISQMVGNIAAAMKVFPDQVNVKATTEEGLGFTGRKEGIAARAICLIETRK